MTEKPWWKQGIVYQNAVLISTALDWTGGIAAAHLTLRPDEGVILG